MKTLILLGATFAILTTAAEATHVRGHYGMPPAGSTYSPPPRPTYQPPTYQPRPWREPQAGDSLLRPPTGDSRGRPLLGDEPRWQPVPGRSDRGRPLHEER